MLVNSRAPDYRFGRYVEPLTTASIISRFGARSTSRSWKTGLRCASPAKSPGRTRARNGQPGHAEGDRQQDRACQRGRERPGRISAPGSRQTLYDILAEKQDITPTMALWNGKLTGTTPEMWMNM